jgi:hypothetical protein
MLAHCGNLEVVSLTLNIVILLRAINAGIAPVYLAEDECGKGSKGSIASGNKSRAKQRLARGETLFANAINSSTMKLFPHLHNDMAHIKILCHQRPSRVYLTAVTSAKTRFEV